VVLTTGGSERASSLLLIKLQFVLEKGEPEQRIVKFSTCLRSLSCTRYTAAVLTCRAALSGTSVSRSRTENCYILEMYTVNYTNSPVWAGEKAWFIPRTANNIQPDRSRTKPKFPTKEGLILELGDNLMTLQAREWATVTLTCWCIYQWIWSWFLHASVCITYTV